MNKKILLIFTAIVLLACNSLFPPKVTTREPDSQPGDSQNFTSTGFSMIRLHPGASDLQTMLAGEAQKAEVLRQMPVVEFDATWCPPCRAIDAAIESKNELMINAYRGTYIIKLDVDEWGWKDSKVQDFWFNAIPIYFKLNSEGQQTGEVIDGGAWGEDIPENIAPVMDAFFHGK
jgi:thiol-disulfide isomerase/thioredoxin